MVLFEECISNVKKIKYSSDKKCPKCKGTYQRILTIIMNNDKEYDMCEFCKVTFIYDPAEVYKYVLMRSEYNQDDIISATVKFVNKNGCIPTPTDIDKDAKLLEYSSQKLACAMSQSDKIRSKSNEDEIKVFFTPEFKIAKIIVRNMFSSKLKFNVDYWDNLADTETVSISKSIIKKIDKLTKKDNKKSLNIVNKAKSTLTAKMEKVT
jgi:hypothetical protein